MANASVSTGAADFFHHRSRLQHAEAGAAVLLGYQHTQKSGVRQLSHELGGITMGAVHLQPVIFTVVGAQLTDGQANVFYLRVPILAG